MLDAVKLSMRPAIKTKVYDADILDLIETAKADLASVGIQGDQTDPLIRQAIKLYCRCNFGNPEQPEKLKAAYDELKAQMQTCSKYTDWRDPDGV